MYTVSRSTRSASTAAVELRALVGQAVPTVVAKALTFTVQKAQGAIAAEMSSLFKGGATPYTLKSTRIETATAQDLSARVAVKDRSTNNGTLPENYLFPEVFGGPRKEKRFERLLRLSGLLRKNERALPGDFAPIDAAGNYKLSELRTLLRSVRGLSRKDGPGTGLKKGKVRGDLFVGKPGNPGSYPGVYARKDTAAGKNKTLEPLLIFVTKQPTYAKRLDFEGIARATAAREFEPTFRRLLAASTR